MKIEIDVPIKLVTDVAERVIRAEFQPADRYASSGVAYQEIMRQVRAALAGQDYSAIIQDEIARQLPLAIRNAVGDEIARLVKAEVGRLRKSGELSAMLGEVEVRHG